METKCYYVIASIVAVFFSYWYRPAFRVVPKHEGRTFILPTHCPIGRPATFQLKEGSGNIFQSLIDGQGKSLRDQLGLSSIEHIKSILFEVCPNLNNPVLIENLHAYNFLSVSSKQLLLNNVQEDFCKDTRFQVTLFSTLLNTNVCVFSSSSWNCTFESYHASGRNIFLFHSNSTKFFGLVRSGRLDANAGNIGNFWHVKRKNWRKRKRKKASSLALAFARKNIPQVFYRTEFEKWTARKAPWNGRYFQKKAQETRLSVSGIYVKSNGADFGPFFDASRPYNTFRQVEPQHNYTENNTMLMQDFIERVEGKTSWEKTMGETSEYYYLSKEIDRIDPTLFNDIQPYNELLRLNPKRTSINCWIGQSGVITPCHYDGYHNIYVQLSGYKMFYLLPPSGRNFVRPYPFLHPSQAQCQLADYMFRHNSKQANALPSVVLLKPGDVLYLPPLWFHSVVSITASYSVNAWTEDLNVARINDLFRMVFPYNNSQKYLNFADKVSRAIAILYQVVTRIYGNSVLQAFDFFKTLKTRRYEALLDSGALPRVKAPSVEETVCYDPRRSWMTYTSVLKEKIAQDYVQKVSSAFNATVSPVARETWLSNYVEYSLASVVGLDQLSLLPRLIDVDVVSCGNLYSKKNAEDELMQASMLPG